MRNEMMSYNTNAQLRFKCHCDTNPSCEWCRGQGFHIARYLGVNELEEIKKQIEGMIEEKEADGGCKQSVLTVMTQHEEKLWDKWNTHQKQVEEMMTKKRRYMEKEDINRFLTVYPCNIKKIMSSYQELEEYSQSELFEEVQGEIVRIQKEWDNISQRIEEGKKQEVRQKLQELKERGQVV